MCKVAKPLHYSEITVTGGDQNSPGSGSWTRRPSTFSSLFSLLIRFSSSSSEIEAGFTIVSLLIPIIRKCQG
jgi:hypothetical protein